MKSQSDSAPVFAVGIALLGHVRPIPISEEVFRDGTLSRSNLAAVTLIEIAYDILVRNFTELIEGQLRAAVQHKMGALTDRSASMSWVQEFNRLVGNLLSSARGYLDQTDNILINVFGDTSNEHESYNNQRALQYDSVFGYRLMENLRNYHQHYSLGITGVSFRMRRTDNTVESQVSFSAEAYFDKTKLSASNTLSNKLKNDLPGLPDKIQILPHIDDYMEGLSSVHESVREQIRHSVIDWMEKLEKVRQIFSGAYPAKELTPTTPIALFEFPDQTLMGPLSTKVFSQELLQDRILLTSKNRQLKNLRNFFVTSQETNKK